VSNLKRYRKEGKMNDLVFIKRNDAFTSSKVIADGTGVAHRKLKETIKKHRKNIEEFGKLSAPYEAESSGGRREQIYVLNEPQAAFLITLLKNKEKVVSFKAELVKQFYQMRRLLAEKQTAEWIETRKQGMLIRKSETNVIQKLVEYAKEQGSTHAEMLYMTYSKLANKMAGITNREQATILQLNDLSTMERVIAGVALDGMEAGIHYKDIYKQSKERLETLTGWLEKAS
jgi:phage regulator Rha-like protein